jgi:hypothetical protein
MKTHKVSVSADEQALLNGVTVRLIKPEEQKRFDQLIETQHYLHSARWVGERLFYVAEYGGEWVALQAWTTSAYHVKARDKWIGWTDRQRQRRLSLVANNSRYLILRPAGASPNLASRVMRLCLDRLSGDFKTRYGHPVWIAESFVDREQFRGTCYKVSGWEHVGNTAGWRRDGEDFYVAHDRPKQLWVREIRPGARTRLRGRQLPEEVAMVEAQVAPECEQTPEELGSFLRYFERIKDWRKWVDTYPLAGLIALVACATLCGVMRGQRDLAAFGRTLDQQQLKALGFHARRRRRRWEPRYTAPSETTFFKMLSKVDRVELERALQQWQTDRLGVRTADDNVVACDGKELRSSQGQASVSAYAVRSGRWLGSEPVEEGSNEIPAAQKLLTRIDLDGQRVLLDALHTQVETARRIVFDGGGDYLLTVKGNQPGIAETLGHLRRGLNRAFSPSASGRSSGSGRTESQSSGSAQSCSF